MYSRHEALGEAVRGSFSSVPIAVIAERARVKAVRIVCVRLLALVIFAATQIFPSSPVGAASLQYYTLARSLKVGGAGGWDYVTLDPAGRFLYVTRSTHAMVVDVSTGELVADIS